MSSIIALIIGNSHLHWGWIQNRNLRQTWETSHLKKPIASQQLPTDFFPPEVARSQPQWVYLASVVAQQTNLWKDYPHKTIITKKDIPLTNLYATLGIDRALCAYGAGETYGYPILVIDGGTALTYTTVGKHRDFLGGAILPGLSLQFKALAQQTAALPETSLPDTLPELWATSTNKAIASGVIYSAIAGIYNYLTAWWQEFPNGVVVLTGGDALSLQGYLQQKYPAIAQPILLDQTVMFQGLIALLS